MVCITEDTDAQIKTMMMTTMMMMIMKRMTTTMMMMMRMRMRMSLLMINLSGLAWLALQRTLMPNSIGFHSGFKSLL